jgi:general secretion pathway protein E
VSALPGTIEMSTPAAAGGPLDAALPRAGVPWAIDTTAWPSADAARWRAVLVVSADRRQWLLLADRQVDAALLQVAETRLRRAVRWHRCDPGLIDHGLAQGDQGFRALDALVTEGEGASKEPQAEELSPARLRDQASPVVRLLDSTLFDALQDGASDVHYESVPRGMVIRCRLDGVLTTMRQVEGTAFAEQIVSRLKVMAELDIGERRLPQDGRFKLRVARRQIDFRLSVLDRAQVEQGQGHLTLDALGFEPGDREAIRRLASLPYGMLLVTGPTGSGKTTTLYAALSEIHTGRDKIVTIEDPVEYQLAGVVQIPVNEKKGLTFARGLRSVLRHDPDKVMVGEIRDTETAQIAVQAALTGHLVFTTVHANNALDVIGRFMHMGLDLYNVVSALNGVLAQRLVRLVCPHCRVPHIAAAAELERVGMGRDGPTRLAHFARGTGCSHCRGTGYRGRKAIAELLLLDDALRDLIASRAPLQRIKQAARERGMRTLREAAVAAACAGQTTLEEVDRVTLAD